MATDETIAWVRPPEPIRGLDHLGVQAPCIALYGQLLPGITNVTDRARYYSFNPWILWSFETRYKDHSLDEFRRVLRRAECLFALIAIRHARQVADSDEGRHGQAMVGRDKLLRIDAASEFSLDEYAALEGPNRYFKNKLGGLGQYYSGPLRDLRILDHSPEGAGSPPGYDRERGRELAEAFASAVPANAFFRLLEKPTAMWDDLDELAPFCPCGLRSNPAEHELLRGGLLTPRPRLGFLPLPIRASRPEMQQSIVQRLLLPDSGRRRCCHHFPVVPQVPRAVRSQGFGASAGAGPSSPSGETRATVAVMGSPRFLSWRSL